jgi:hypothetical protein
VKILINFREGRRGKAEEGRQKAKGRSNPLFFVLKGKGQSAEVSLPFFFLLL